MVEKQVIFICRSCEERNKVMLGMPNYTIRTIEYESLTEAYNHMISTHHDDYNVIHHIEAITRD